eukprot:TRINITY_DN9352_c0_g1_i2.p1 TRINITY_DN9352_c0_g1~~TRINITY_DN9352_c0_g1_i2.p1  ORF type:complete len:411 (-),score=125.56 TRINITY_DN9352_c0_g1_i2:39-1271(-)
MIIRRLPNIFSLFLLKLATSQAWLFGFSFVLGVLLAISAHLYQVSTRGTFDTTVPTAQYDWAYEKWLYSQGQVSRQLDTDISRYRDRLINDTSFEDKIDHNTEAFYLYNKVKVFCMVFPTNADSALTIKNTWGKHCNKIFFFHDKNNDSIVPVVRIPAKSSFDLLCQSVHQIIDTGEVFDWLLVTTEDTFALPENLRYYVAPFNSSQPYYLGHAMKFWSQVYNWGNSGYTLSRGAVNLLQGKFETASKCETGGKYWRNGDWYLGKHMASLGVKVRDTRDHLGKGRFNGYSFKKLLFPGAVSAFERFWKDSIYLSQDGPKCCSNYAITFHGIMSKSKMYQLEYLFYHLRPFPYSGSIGNIPPPPPPENPYLTMEEKLKNEAMDRWFQSSFQLLTTPKNMHLLIQDAFTGED